jgi:hypothetical protein
MMRYTTYKKYSIFIIIGGVLLLSQIDFPNKTLNGLFLVLTLSYFMWWRKTRTNLISFVLANFIISYWLAEAVWRIRHNILYMYHYTVPTQIAYVSSQKAILGALPYVMISIAIFIAMLLIQKKKKSFAYLDIDLVPHDDTEWIEEIKQNAKNNKMVAYSKNGSRAARIKATELGIKDAFVDFVSKEVADRERGYTQAYPKETRV